MDTFILYLSTIRMICSLLCLVAGPLLRWNRIFNTPLVNTRLIWRFSFPFSPLSRWYGVFCVLTVHHQDDIDTFTLRWYTAKMICALMCLASLQLRLYGDFHTPLFHGQDDMGTYVHLWSTNRMIWGLLCFAGTSLRWYRGFYAHLFYHQDDIGTFVPYWSIAQMIWGLSFWSLKIKWVIVSNCESKFCTSKQYLLLLYRFVCSSFVVKVYQFGV